MEPTNNQTTQLSPIANDRAITFIEKFVKEKNEPSNFQIPSAWLYERGIKESIERAATSGMMGLRFYSAIDVEKYPTEPGKLTFIMVPAMVNDKGVFEDLSNEVVYEFSQICPDMCSIGVTGNFIEFDGSFTVPNHRCSKHD